MSSYQAEKWRYRIQNLFGMGILERLARPKLLWFYIYAEPLPDAPDYKNTIGGFVDVWVFHSDSLVAEQIARKVIADKKWRCGNVPSPKVVTRWTYKRRFKTFPNHARRSLAHFDEAFVLDSARNFAVFHGMEIIEMGRLIKFETGSCISESRSAAVAELSHEVTP